MSTSISQPKRPIPLSVPVIMGNEQKYLQQCIESGWVSSSGPWVERFEKEFARYVGVSEAVAVVNGTAALHLALQVSGVEAEDEVLVPTLTFMATINSVHYLGAAPVFLDCDSYLNLDLNKVAAFLQNECEMKAGTCIRRKTGKRVRAIIAVHVFGHPMDVAALMRIVEPYGIQVIEDAAESLGSRFASGAHTGTQGDFGCFSFNGNKIATCGGGGMVLARDPAKLKRIRYLSTQAKDDEVFFEHGDVGYNYRLTSLQAALGIAQLELVDRFVETKRKNLLLYSELIERSGFGKILKEPKGTFSNSWLATLCFHEEKTPDLRSLIQYLQSLSIQTRPVWQLNHRQKPYRSFEAYQVDNAVRLYPRLLSLPSSSDLAPDEVRFVVSAIEKYIETNCR